MLSVKELKHWINTLDEDSNIAIINNGTVLVELTSVHTLNPKFIRVGGIPDEMTDNVVRLLRKSIIGEEVMSYAGDQNVREGHHVPPETVKGMGSILADSFRNNFPTEPAKDTDDERPVLNDQWFQEADAYQGDKLVEPGKPWVDPDDAPPLGKDFFDNAEIRQGDIVIRAGRNSVRGMTKTHTPVDGYPFQKRDASTLSTLDELLDEDGIREEVTEASKEMTLVRVFESDGHSHLTSCRKDEDMSAFVAAREDVVKVETTEGQQLWPLPPENIDGSETNDPGNTKSN